MPRSRLRLFLILLFLSVLTMTLQNRYGAFRPFLFLSYPLDLVNEGHVVAVDYMEDTLEKYTLKEEKLRELEREVNSMKLKEQRNKELLLENQRLKELLGLKKSLGGFVLAAKVVSRGSGRWSNAYVIDKGTDDWVEKDMTVITEDGLLGKIQEAHGPYSVVLLVDDARFSAGVRLQDSRTEAVLSGAGLNRAIVKYVDADTEVSEGELLVTSGLDGLFPPGIPVAFVSSIKTREGALFHRIDALPLVDTTKIEEVIIVKR